MFISANIRFEIEFEFEFDLYIFLAARRLQRHSDVFSLSTYISNARYPICSHSLELEMNSEYAFVCFDVFIDTERDGGHGKANPCMRIECFY